MKSKSWFVNTAVALALLASLILIGYGSARGVPRQAKLSAQPSAALQIDNFSFSPASLTISAGTTVTWSNKDDVPHTIVGDDKSFKSGALDTDDKFSHTFTKPGTFSYFCGLHPKMTGKIVVEPAS